MNFFKSKLILIAICFLALFYFSNDFGLINVEKSAIVTAIGLDKIDEELKLSVQIAIPDNAQSSGSSKSAVFSAKGSTIAETISKIGTKTGWYPKLSFCNVIVLGKSIIYDDVMKYIDYFSKSLKIQGSALLAVADDAEEILATATPLDNVSSFALQKIILPTDGMETKVLSCDIKTFTIGYSSRASSSYAPYIKIKDTPQPTSTQENSSNKKTPYVYDATKTAIFKNGVVKGFLSEEETIAMVYIKKDQKDTLLTKNNVTIDGETAGYTIAINKSNTKVKLKTDGDKIQVFIKQKLNAKTADESFKNKTLSDNPQLTVPKEVISSIESTLKQGILSLVKTTFNNKVDLLGLDDKLYRFYHSEYDKLKQKLYDIDSVKIDVKIISSK
jgi:spore germination protein KC